MISEFFIAVGTAIGAWFVDLLPDADWSDGVVVTAANSVSTLMAGAGAISNWFPFDFLMVCLVFTMGTFIALFMVKGGLRLMSYIPFFGGAG